MHLPQAGLWLLFSLFTFHAWTGRWTTDVDFDIWYNRHFAHSLMIAAFWVRPRYSACTCAAAQKLSYLNACASLLPRHGRRSDQCCNA